MVCEPAYRRLYGCALVAIGLGSYFYHASLSFAGQVCDMSGMYLLITFALLYGVARENQDTHWCGDGDLHGVECCLVGFSDDLSGSATIRICGVGAGGAGDGNKISNDFRSVRLKAGGCHAAAILLGLAFLVWVLDITKVVCSPESALQGHALWHVLGALAGWCLYRYYESEDDAYLQLTKCYPSYIRHDTVKDMRAEAGVTIGPNG